MTIYHSEVPAPLRGRGYGYHLVCGTLDEVRRLKFKVVPQCWVCGRLSNDGQNFRTCCVSRRRCFGVRPVRDLMRWTS
jgi:predicted GNAT family acetyltransferase